MSLWNYFEATFFVTVLTGVILAVPYYLLYERFFGVSRPTLLLALMGLLAFLGILRPPGVPLWGVWLVSFVGLGVARLYSQGAREPFLAPLREPITLGILILPFGLYFLRWEPLGEPLLQVAVLARLIQQPEGLWGSALPFLDSSLQGVRVGFALLAGLIHLGEWAPIERVVGFLNLAAFSLFVFSLASGWNTWFSRRSSVIAAAIFCLSSGLVHKWVFDGGGEILLALTSGMILLEYARTLRVGAPEWPKVIIFGFALGFGFYCHVPVALYTVSLFLPVSLWMTLRSPRWQEFLVGWARVGSVLLGVTLPLWFVFSFPTAELGPTIWDHYKQMVPALMGSGSLLVDGARQFSEWLSFPALLLGLLGFLLHLQYDGRPMTFVPSLFLGFVGLVSVALVRYSSFSGGWFFHPEAAAFAVLFALGVAIPWGLDRLLFEGVRKERRWLRVGLVVVTVAGLPSLGGQINRLWHEPGLTPAHHRVMSYAYQFLPPGDCVEVTGRVEPWLAPKSGRCIVPFPGLPTHFPELPRQARLGADWALGSAERGLSVHQGPVPLVRISNKPLPVPIGRD